MPHARICNNDHSATIRANDAWSKQSATAFAKIRISDFDLFEPTRACEQQLLPMVMLGYSGQQRFISQAVTVKKQSLASVAVDQIQQHSDRVRFRRQVRKCLVCPRRVETKLLAPFPRNSKSNALQRGAFPQTLVISKVSCVHDWPINQTFENHDYCTRAMTRVHERTHNHMLRVLWVFDGELLPQVMHSQDPWRHARQCQKLGGNTAAVQKAMPPSDTKPAHVVHMSMGKHVNAALLDKTIDEDPSVRHRRLHWS